MLDIERIQQEIRAAGMDGWEVDDACRAVV